MDSRREQILEAKLVLECQLGEPAAFRQLVALFEPRLLYYFRRFEPDAAAAADLLQETWLHVFRKLKYLREPAAFRAWLYRIAHDQLVSRLRTDLARSKSEQTYAAALPETEDLTLDEAIDAARLHHLLDRLTPCHREALTLYYLEDMSYTEIAAATQSSLGTVKSRLFYAKRELRSLLEAIHD